MPPWCPRQLDILLGRSQEPLLLLLLLLLLQLLAPQGCPKCTRQHVWLWDTIIGLPVVDGQACRGEHAQAVHHKQLEEQASLAAASGRAAGCNATKLHCVVYFKAVVDAGESSFP